MNRQTTVRVWLWGREVGLLLESEGGGRITFECDGGFRDSGLEISPIHLPLARAGPASFPELARKPAFLGLPGVFADALPDRFGNAVIRRYFEARGRPEEALSPLQRLLYVGDRAMGALEFRPPHDRGGGTEEALEVRTLVDQARRVIEGDVSVAIPEMMQVGASAGGARPKALILWNRETGRVRSGFARPEIGEELWLIKFDGASRDASGLGMRSARRPGPWGRIEFAYSNLARDAGIDLAETHLLRDGDLAHFMTRRFDRPVAGGGATSVDRGRTEPEGGDAVFERLHLHSLGGLQHVDFNDQFVFSYEGWFDTIRALGLGQESVNEAFRRMVFSVATVNFDDHVKNFAFLMDRARSLAFGARLRPDLRGERGVDAAAPDVGERALPRHHAGGSAPRGTHVRRARSRATHRRSDRCRAGRLACVRRGGGRPGRDGRVPRRPLRAGNRP